MPSNQEIGRVPGPTKEMILGQLDSLLNHPSLRSSKRLVAFLQFTVAQALDGSADRLKERTIGIEVFDRDPDYDTSTDHIVRTAASELRKRLAVYYGDEAHRRELRIEIPAGSYIPQFTIPDAGQVSEEDQASGVSSSAKTTPGVLEPPVRKGIGKRVWIVIAVFSGVVLISAAISFTRSKETPASKLWKPVIQEQGQLLFVVGSTPQDIALPTLDAVPDSQPSPENSLRHYPTMPVADAVAMARISSFLNAEGKSASFRQDTAASFSDIQGGPAVFIGLLNNSWSLRFSRPLRFNFAVDSAHQLLYIRDRQNPAKRDWSVPSVPQVDLEKILTEGKTMTDYALISRIENSETGKVMIVIGGLYAYGTDAAGKFVTDPQLENLAGSIPIDHSKRNLQIILRTDVIQGIPGPPKIVAFSEE